MTRGTRPTPEQKAAREQLAEARQSTLERKKRTRQLIQMGGVLAAYGFDSEQQVDELMRAMVRDDANRQWLQERGVRQTERWPDDSYGSSLQDQDISPALHHRPQPPSAALRASE